MKDLIVLMGNSTGELRGTMPLYLSQLSKAGIDHHVEPITDWANSGGGFIGWKVQKVRDLAERFADYERIIITDAFDVVFFGTKEAVIARFPTDGVLHAAEKNCHPPECRSLAIPDVGPHRFANGGMFCGTPASLLKWCDEVEAHPLYRPNLIDQQLLNMLLADRSPLAQIDSQTRLFFCLYGGYPELEFERGEPVNRQYDTWPLFLHANGGWDSTEMFAKYGRSIA